MVITIQQIYHEYRYTLAHLRDLEEDWLTPQQQWNIQVKLSQVYCMTTVNFTLINVLENIKNGWGSFSKKAIKKLSQADLKNYIDYCRDVQDTIDRYVWEDILPEK
ncbi:hypothetical protein OXYTRIMIC_210 [Oxytricha trifallax]|uniref:Uncharacterized protein n=1 Tax=Oxytricha trifallax TaxID=1172189 RepID=A0A073HX23_9SPIT|nr:hypothetical protein OXYTRIMIC_210 [Oxytricha trifallax]